MDITGDCGDCKMRFRRGKLRHEVGLDPPVNGYHHKVLCHPCWRALKDTKCSICNVETADARGRAHLYPMRWRSSGTTAHLCRECYDERR
jgi:hypothetical protein